VEVKVLRMSTARTTDCMVYERFRSGYFVVVAGASCFVM
jgi:hypothetical protein